ncbi:MAG: zinc metalloprotease [Nitrososphaeraceae archaeon]
MSEKRRKCGTSEVNKRLLDQIPGYAFNRRSIEAHSLTWGKVRSLIKKGPQIVTLPVVVHVIWNSQEQNISEEQINSQIKILNEDYRMRNSDIGSIPSPFRPLASDCYIEFKLACRDPEGNTTNGITRTRTNKSSFDTDDSVKFSSSSGINAWPTEKYLNIWVCNLGGGLLGYAQFPGGPVETDGVVVTFTAFGNMGTAAPPFNKGRTTTHEVGHWLNLYHIWGDDTWLSDPCSGSDNVADTPNQAGENYGTPSFPHISCNNAPDGDMFVNYMDYTDDESMFMFTKGQVLRMEATLSGPRLSLTQSDALNCFMEEEPIKKEKPTLIFDGANKYVPPSSLGI